MDTVSIATRQPKQARAIRTRERILDQAEQAFAEKGFEAASLTSDILEPAGISVGSFYHQFSDKRSVLYALLDERRTWHRPHVVDAESPSRPTNFTDAVRSGLLELFDDIDDHPATWWIHFREINSSDPEIRGLIEQSWAAWSQSLRESLAEWVKDPAKRTEGRMRYATSGLSGVLRHYLAGDASTRREMRLRALDDVVAACVASLAH